MHSVCTELCNVLMGSLRIYQESTSFQDTGETGRLCFFFGVFARREPNPVSGKRGFGPRLQAA